MKKLLILGAVLVGLVLLLRILPIKVDYIVTFTGKVFPGREWMVGRTPDGRVTSTIKNNLNDLISAYNAQQYQQGDQFDFSLDPKIGLKTGLSEGEIVGYFFSSAMQQQLANLEGQLQVERANLNVVSTGQKQEIIDQMKKNLELAKEKRAIQQKLFARSTALYRDSLIAPQEYDLARNALEMAQISYELAETQYQNAITGDKPESVELAKEKINAMEIQISALKKRLSKLEVRAPFSGLIQHKKGSVDLNFEIILNLLDTSEMIVLTPVQLQEMPFVRVGQHMEYVLFNNTARLDGEVIAIDNTIQLVGGRQVMYVTSKINRPYAALAPGLFVQSLVNCGEISLWDYLGRTFGTLIFR